MNVNAKSSIKRRKNSSKNKKILLGRGKRPSASSKPTKSAESLRRRRD